MNIFAARTLFSARSMMLSSVKWNFKSNPKYAAEEYKCEWGNVDMQDNLLTWFLYKNLREGLDLINSDSDLVIYYQLVFEERQKKNNNNTWHTDNDLFTNLID